MLAYLETIRAKLRTIEDHLTVRTQIAVAGAAITFLLVVSLAGAAALISYRDTSALLNSKLAATASITAERMDRFMQIRQQEIRLFSQLEPLRPLWQNDPVALGRALDQLQASFSDFAWIGFAAPDGKVIASTRGMLKGVSVAERQWFKEGLSDLAIVDVHEAKLLATLLAQPASGEPLRFVDISLPVHAEDGTLIGVLGAHLDWEWARNMIASIAANHEGGATALSVLSREGVVLVGAGSGRKRHDDRRISEILQVGAGTFTDNDHLTAFYVGKGHRDYRGLNWIVTASQPKSVALRAALASAQLIIGLGILIGLVGIALATLVAARISRPIHALTKEADRLGRESGPTMLQRQSGSLEVVQLSRALRALLRRIGFAEERTREARARALEDAQHFQKDISQLRRLADTDFLTGLLNRRAFLVAAEDARAYCHRYERNMATLMIDIDHFKSINDRYGHAAGDEAIKQIARIVEKCIRTTDKAARFGGEEFVVLLREIDEAQAMALAERIRTTIEEQPVLHGGGTMEVTVSIGISLFAKEDRDVQDMIARADQGLYAAKNQGRNRTVLIAADKSGVARAA